MGFFIFDFLIFSAWYFVFNRSGCSGIGSSIDHCCQHVTSQQNVEQFNIQLFSVLLHFQYQNILKEPLHNLYFIACCNKTVDCACWLDYFNVCELIAEHSLIQICVELVYLQNEVSISVSLLAEEGIFQDLVKVGNLYLRCAI